MMYVSNIIPVNLFGYKMTTKVVETITPLYTTARLKRELFSFTSLVSDAVFEDNFDSLDNLIRADVPAPAFENQNSDWESIVSYLCRGVEYIWKSNTSVDSTQYDIGDFL